MLSAACGTFQTCTELLSPPVRVLPTPLRRDGGSLPPKPPLLGTQSCCQVGQGLPLVVSPRSPIATGAARAEETVFRWNVTLRSSSPAPQVPLATGALGLWRGLDAAQSAQAPGEPVARDQLPHGGGIHRPASCFLLLASLLLEGLFCFVVESGSPVAQAALRVLTLILLLGFLSSLWFLILKNKSKQTSEDKMFQPSGLCCVSQELGIFPGCIHTHNTHSHTRAHKCTHIRMRMHLHAHTEAYAHSHIHTYTSTHVHAHMHAHTFLFWIHSQISLVKGPWGVGCEFPTDRLASGPCG